MHTTCTGPCKDDACQTPRQPFSPRASAPPTTQPPAGAACLAAACRCCCCNQTATLLQAAWVDSCSCCCRQHITSSRGYHSRKHAQYLQQDIHAQTQRPLPPPLLLLPPPVAQVDAATAVGTPGIITKKFGSKSSSRCCCLTASLCFAMVRRLDLMVSTFLKEAPMPSSFTAVPS